MSDENVAKIIQEAAYHASGRRLGGGIAGPPRPIPEVVAEWLPTKLEISEADGQRLIEAAEAEQQRIDAAKKTDRLDSFRDAVGRRFAEATLDGYVADRTEQRKVLTRLRGYADAIDSNIREGRGIVLFGPAGTGKSHLVTAMGRLAIEAGYSVEWRNAASLFQELRAAIDDPQKRESRIVSPLTEADVLILDDLLPVGGALTAWQASMSYSVVDARYRNCRPTWTTLNAANGPEAEQGAGVQVVDRLRDGALCLHCDWPSHRRAAS